MPKLQELNAARKLGAALSPVKASDPLGIDFLAKKGTRITTLAELNGGGEKVDLLSGEHEPHLLVEDLYNPGRCNTVWVAAGTGSPDRRGMTPCDTEKGAVLLAADTLIYWK